MSRIHIKSIGVIYDDDNDIYIDDKTMEKITEDDVSNRRRLNENEKEKQKQIK